jgi:hypothetical protein
MTDTAYLMTMLPVSRSGGWMTNGVGLDDQGREEDSMRKWMDVPRFIAIPAYEASHERYCRTDR